MNTAAYTANIINKGTFYTVAISNHVDAAFGSEEYYMQTVFCEFGMHFGTESAAKAFAASKQVQKVVKIANA